MVLLSLSIVMVAQYWGYKSKKAETLQRTSKRIGIGMLLLWLIYNAYYFYPSNFRWETSLPFHVCDLLGPIAAIALFSSYRLPRAVLYFCGLTLAGQALLTPTGNQDPATLRFWLYWLLHAGIISVFLFDLTIRAYRPSFIDLRQVLYFDLAYAVLISPLNIAFNWNYGYLGNSKPDVPTIVDFLGPWPERILAMLLLAGLVQAAMYLPWMVVRILKRQSF